MIFYLAKKVLLLILTLFLVSFIVFALVRFIPGDPVLAIAGAEATPEVIEETRLALGLNRPMLDQYFVYLKGFVHGDLGSSLKTHQSVWEDIIHRLPASLELALAGMFVSVAVGMTLGIIAGLRPGNWADLTARFISLIGVSSPTFWTGLLFVLAFGYYWRLFPIAGSGTLRHLVLPAVTVSLTSMAFLTRLTRATLMEVLSEDYIRTARAKGLPPVRVILKHALRNSLIAPLTVAGLEFGRLMSGVIVIEIIFAWPGIGKLLIDSIQFRDWPVIQGLILVYAFIFALANTGVDLIYPIIDPRMRQEIGQR